MNNVCINLWKGLHIGTLGEVKPCCFWNSSFGNIHDGDVYSQYNTVKAQSFRSRMLSGEKLPECRLCYEQEDRGMGSLRKSNNRRVSFAEEELSTVVPLNPYFLDLRQSNTCQLKCRMCSHVASSRWQQDEPLPEGLKIITKEDRRDLYNLVVRFKDTIKEIYVAGGEPTLIEEDWKILKFCLDNRLTNILLRYNTNLQTITHPVHGNIVDLWRKWLDMGGRLQLGISVDACGELGEWIREFSSWKKTVSNLEYLIDVLNPDQDRCIVELTSVVSIYNILALPDLIRFTENVGLGADRLCTHNVLTWPVPLNPQILPDKYRKNIKENLTKLVVKEKNSTVRKRMVTYYREIRNILKTTIVNDHEDEMDGFYDETFNRLVPELANWWKK